MAQGMRAEKAAEWQQRMERFRRAATSVAQFCYDEGISTPSFYIWRRKLRQGGGSAPVRRQVPKTAAKPRKGSFVPVRVVGGSHLDGHMTAELTGGMRLSIPLADPGALRTAIGALVRADAEHAGDTSC